MPQPWNDWYHVVSHVYGSWLRGDPRGWRCRNHKLHVQGDYKRPPKAGEFDSLHARSRALMKRPAVYVQADLRQIVAEAVVDKLESDGIEVLVLSVDAEHVHLLGRFRDHEPRHWVGRAKKNASHVVRQQGLRADKGGLWAKCSRPKAIRDRAHQLNTFYYIMDHGKRGAAVWTFRQKKKANG